MFSHALLFGRKRQQEIERQGVCAQRQESLREAHRRSPGVVAPQAVEAVAFESRGIRVAGVAGCGAYRVVVGVQEQRRARRVEACGAGEDVVVQSFGCRAVFRQVGEDEVGRAAFVARRGGRCDQRPEQVDGFLGFCIHVVCELAVRSPVAVRPQGSGVLPDYRSGVVQQVLRVFDRDTPYAVGNGFQCVLDLGDHPFADDAAGFERGVRLGRDFADERRLVVRVVQHAVFSKQKTSSVGAIRAAPSATDEATLSALQLSSVPCPSCMMAQNTGVTPAPRSSPSSVWLTLSMSPTKP